MEGWRQIGGGLESAKENADGSETTVQRNREGNTLMLACHFLRTYYMDLGHPSRLPYGSLRSAWTGPGRDPRGFYSYEKMAGYFWHDLACPPVGRYRVSCHHDQMGFNP
jgi:hypothetical protein